MIALCLKGPICLLWVEQTKGTRLKTELMRHCKNSGKTPSSWTKVVTLGEEVVRTGKILHIF